jgi:DNA-binding response OmpR family regulator
MKLLIVEDDVEYATALEAELAALGHGVTVSDNGPTALTMIEREGFDAVVLDSMLPQLGGVAVVERLRAAGHSLPVLMLSALGRSAEKIDGLTAGADDYCVKPTPAAEIEARLNALLRARGWTAGEADTLHAGDIVVSPGQHRAWRADQPLDLTRLEFGLLAELVRHAGSFLTRAMLIERVWGYDFEPGTNIVDAQVRLLRRKLTADGRDDPIVTKRGVGYMLRP